MILVSSPDGVLLGAGQTVGEVKAIMRRAATDFLERRRHEEITDSLLMKLADPSKTVVDSAMVEIEAIKSKTSDESIDFIYALKLEEVEK